MSRKEPYLDWRETATVGPPLPNRTVVLYRALDEGSDLRLADPSVYAYDVGVWRTAYSGYWSTRGQVRVRTLKFFTYWAYVEGPI